MKYYVRKTIDDQPEGPFSYEEIKIKIKDNKISSNWEFSEMPSEETENQANQFSVIFMVVRFFLPWLWPKDVREWLPISEFIPTSFEMREKSKLKAGNFRVRVTGLITFIIGASISVSVILHLRRHPDFLTNLGKQGSIVTQLSLVLEAIPLFICFIGLLEMMTGTPFHKLNTKWSTLDTGSQFLGGCAIIIAVVFLIIAVTAILVR